MEVRVLRFEGGSVVSGLSFFKESKQKVEEGGFFQIPEENPKVFRQAVGVQLSVLTAE